MTPPDALTVLEVTVRGLSLWVPRPGFVDVLFPATAGLGINIHDVKLTLASGGKSSLNGKVLDLRAITPVFSEAQPLATAGFPGILVPPDAPAAKADVILNHEFCMAGMRLPYGAMAPHPEPLEGPFLYRGNPNTFLGHGVVWRCAYDPGTVFDAHLSRQDGTAEPVVLSLGTAHQDSGRLQVSITCLAPEDETTEESLKTNDVLYDFVAYHRLTQSPDSGRPAPPDVPTFRGADTRWRTAEYATYFSLHPAGPVALDYSLRRLCGSTHAELI